MRNLFTTKMSVLFVAGFAGLACSASGPKQKSWTRYTKDTRDDQTSPRYMTKQHVDQARAQAMTGESVIDAANYAMVLTRFIWETHDFFAAANRARTDPEYDFTLPESLAGFDASAYLADLDTLEEQWRVQVGTLNETGLGTDEEFLERALTGLHASKIFARLDCDEISEQAAYGSACSTTMGAGMETVVAVCGAEIESFCRNVYDQLTDTRKRYYLMGACNDQMGGDEMEALARWATAEEIESFSAERVKIHEEYEAMQNGLARKKASAANENERRIAEYEDQRKNFENSQGPIERHSQIGSLDGDNRAPDAPELIGAVGVPGRDRPKTSNRQAPLTIVSQCAQPLLLDLGEGQPRVDVPANGSVDVEMETCTTMCLYSAEGESGGSDKLDCTLITRPTGFEILDTCAHMVRSWTSPE